MTIHLHTRLHDFRWKLSGRQTQLVANVESRRTRLEQSGLIFQETMDQAHRRMPLPESFGRALKLWERFGREERSLESIELGYQKQMLRYQGQRSLPTTHVWNIHLNLTSPGLGLHLISMKRHKELDHRKLMTRLRMIGRMKHVKPLSAPKIPILIEGDLLIESLAGAISHLSDSNEGKGRWLELQDEALYFLEDLGLGEPERRFIPDELVPVPNPCWQALAFDRRHRSFICFNGFYGAPEFVSYKLPEPMYRLFPKLDFCRGVEQTMSRGVLYELPTAILSEN